MYVASNPDFLSLEEVRAGTALADMFPWMKLVCHSYFSGPQSQSTHLCTKQFPGPVLLSLSPCQESPCQSDCRVADILI